MVKEGGSTFIFKEKSWEPVVEVNDGALIYCVPVACGHFEKQFNFEISNEEFDVLKSDEERRYFLYAVLHYRYQALSISTALQPHYGFEQILFGNVEEVERFLSSEDIKSNGSVSNLVGIFMQREQKPMQAGKWFLKRGSG